MSKTKTRTSKPRKKHTIVRPGIVRPSQELLAHKQRMEFFSRANTLIDNEEYEVVLKEAGERLLCDPKDAHMWNLYGIAAQHAATPDDAAQAFCRAIEIDPELVKPWGNLASLYVSQGNVPAALRTYETLLERKEIPEMRSSKIYLMQRSVEDKQQVFEACKQYGEIYDRPSPLPLKNEPYTGERPIRIGYVSGDFCAHSVFYFIEPILRHHNHEEFEVYAFSMTPEDFMTEKLKPYFDHWFDVRELNDNALFSLIRRERIDILIDLSGHTLRNRLPVFGMRAAPVQCTWIGNPGSTGLKEMDYRLYHIPENEQQYYTEKSDGGFGVWVPEACAPKEVAPAPFLENGHLTLGAFNKFDKVSDEVLAVWARLLNALPDTVLIIVTKDASQPLFQQKIVATLNLAGEQNFAERLVFVERQPLAKYLKLFDLIDINLDPWPYTGGTTTLHAAWAGVPTVTLDLPSNAITSGRDILTDLGLQDELIAHSPEEYIQIVQTLNQNRDRLTELRETMRSRMRASSIMDYAGQTLALENQFKRFMQRWTETDNARLAIKPHHQQHLSSLPRNHTMSKSKAKPRKKTSSRTPGQQTFKVGSNVWMKASPLSQQELLAQKQRLEFFLIAKKLVENKEYEVVLEEAGKCLLHDPKDAHMWNLYGIAAQHIATPDDAAQAFCRAIEIDPEMVEAWGNLASLHASQGNVPAALRAYEAGLKRKENPLVRGSMIFFMQRFVKDKQQVFEACRKYGEIYDRPSPLPFKNEPYDGDEVNARYAYLASSPLKDPPHVGRRLKLGYVSGDFCSHSVYYFIEPILRHHCHEEFEVYAFSMTPEDFMTEKLKPYFDHWFDVRDMDDNAMWKLIRDERIDILVDLSGHTYRNRLPVFGMRAAPVQCTWIGNPGTTGLKEMDYRLYPTPENEQQYYTEKTPISAITKKPTGVGVWVPEERAPAEVAPSPFLENGHLTLGAFNDFNKVSDEVLAVWAHLLNALPDTVLIIVTKDASQPLFQQKIVATLNLAGEQNFAERLVFVERQPLAKYLKLFDLIDINLDPWPYNGGTTTLHAAWAGVPTITLYDPTNSVSSGRDILTDLGLQDELVAHSPEEYIQKVQTLNQNRNRLKELRETMRERMRASCLMNYELQTHKLEILYKRFMRNWSLTGKA